MAKWPVIATFMALTACNPVAFFKAQSGVKSDATGELRETAKFFADAWKTDYVLNFSKLPLKGEAERIPWSGYWYPYDKNGTTAYDTLSKYDRAFGTSATAWELSAHSSKKVFWHGHCNGFAAASMRHQPPEKEVVRNGVTFTPVNIRALLAEIYMSARFIHIGGGKCDSTGTPAHPDTRQYPSSQSICNDINPASFHVGIANWIGLREHSVIFDRVWNEQVWNSPLFRYWTKAKTISEQEALNLIRSTRSTWVFNTKATSFQDVTTTITYADLYQDYERTENSVEEVNITYRYVLELNDAGEVIGGEWAESSRLNHPDFLWVALAPFQNKNSVKLGNPRVDVTEVLEMWAESVGYDSLAEVPQQFQAEAWVDSWGDTPARQFRVDGSRRPAVLRSEALELGYKFKPNETNEFEPELYWDGVQTQPVTLVTDPDELKKIDRKVTVLPLGPISHLSFEEEDGSEWSFVVRNF